MLHKKIYHKLKSSYNEFLFKYSIKSISKNPTGKRVLVYHGVTKNAKKDINTRFISTADFERQISYFKANFNVVSLDDFFKIDNDKSPFTIAITFDDGYLNNLSEALPILEKYEVPAAFFITTIQKAEYNYLWADLLDLYRYTGPQQFTFEGTNYRKGKHEYNSENGSLKKSMKESGWELKKKLTEQIISNNNFIKNKELQPYFELMNATEIKQLSESKYASIGSHALYHNCLSKIDLPEAELELKESKNYLEKITGKAISNFAYPDGDYNKDLIDLVEKTGYENQLIVDYISEEDSKDSRISQRFGINPYISFNNQIQCIIDGKY